MRELRRFEQLKGYALLARDGEIGTIEEMYFDDARWIARYFVVRTGGWLLGREVLIAPRAVTSVEQRHQRIAVDLTREQIEKSPPVGTEKPVSRHYEAELQRYYGWEPYWVVGIFGGPVLPAAHSMSTPTEPPREPENPHLRASTEVTGYRIRTSDGALGQVEDFLIDDRDWRIRYVLVAIRKWLSGKRVPIAPAWVSHIDWAAGEMAVDLDSASIESAPAYDTEPPVDRQYELTLFEHYGRTLEEEID